MNRGDVLWARLPEPAGRQPVLILSRQEAVSARNHVVVALVTSRGRGIASEVRLDESDGMPRPCVVTADVIQTVPKANLGSIVTRLSDSKMRRVEGAIHFTLALKD